MTSITHEVPTVATATAAPLTRRGGVKSTPTAKRPSTAKRLMTAAEFVRKYGDTDGVELHRGKLVRMPMQGAHHGEIASMANYLVKHHVLQHKLGRVCGNDTFVRIHTDPDSYYGADVLYISYKKLPKKVPTPKGPLEVPPDLCIEVRSPTDRLKAVVRKAQDYLDAGVTAVMVIDPETESLAVFRADELPIRFHNGDTVTIPDVLPGFAVPEKAFFE
jgi:Uma2 family endonuclease